MIDYQYIILIAIPITWPQKMGSSTEIIDETDKLGTLGKISNTKYNNSMIIQSDKRQHMHLVFLYDQPQL